MSDTERENDGSDAEQGSDIEAPPTIADLPLTAEMVASNLSLLAPTSNGLQHAYVKLLLKEKALTDILVLKDFPLLRFVDLSGNHITDISVLNGLSELCTLNLNGNALASANIEPLTYLQTLEVAGNKLEAVSGIRHPLLKRLNLSSNGLTEVSGIMAADVPAIDILELQQNKFTELGSIQLPTLTVLDLDDNTVASMLGISILVNLKRLSLRRNKISNLDGFSATNKALSEVYFDENQIESVAEFTKLGCLPSLKSLTMVENPVDQESGYRLEMLIAVASLEVLDDTPFESEEKAEAAIERVARAKARAEAEADAQRASEEPPATGVDDATA